jgi:glutathione S-transferase
MAYVNTGFTAAFTPHWLALEMDPPEPDLQATLRGWGRERTVERHDKLEEMIEDTPFLLGDKPILVSAVFIGMTRWPDFQAVADQSRWPKLAALHQRLEADPVVIYATALKSGEVDREQAPVSDMFHSKKLSLNSADTGKAARHPYAGPRTARNHRRNRSGAIG